MKTKFVHKFLFLLIIILVIGCGKDTTVNCANGTGNCFPVIKCEDDSDCPYEEDRGQLICYEGTGECEANPCDDSYECGMGTCIPHDNPDTEEREGAYCKCDENAQSYLVNDIHDICVPKCNSDLECSDFKIAEMEYQYCDLGLGNCVFNKP